MRGDEKAAALRKNSDLDSIAIVVTRNRGLGRYKEQAEETRR
jgi:hypothetical protein